MGSDGSFDDEYSVDETFSSGGRTRVAAGNDCLVFGSDEGRLDIVTGTDRNRIRTDDPVVDVAAGRYPFALFDAAVAAFTSGGLELWRQRVADGTHLVAPSGGGPLCVVTEGGELVGLDPETGSERFRRERPHDDVSDVSAVTGGHGRIAVAAWSFLTVVSEGGEVVLDHSFDGVVTDIALTANLAVAALKDGRLVGVDLTAGEEAWAVDDGAGAVAPADEAAVLVAFADELAVVDDDGDADPLDVPAETLAAAIPDGAALATVGEGSVAVYRPVTDPVAAVTASVDTDRADPSRPVRVVVENEGDRAAVADLGVDFGERAVAAGAPSRVDLEAGERAAFEVGVAAVDDPGDGTVTVTVDEAVVATGTVRFEEPEALAEQVATRTRLDRLDRGRARWCAVLEHTGSVAVDVSGEGETRHLEPGEEREFEFESAYEPGARVERTVTLATDGASETLPFAVDLPDRPLSVAVEQDRSGGYPYVDVELTSECDVPVAADVTISVADEFTRERAYELAPGTATVVALALPVAPSEPFPVAVTCSGTDTDKRSRLSGWPDLDDRAVPTDRRGRRRESDERPAHGRRDGAGRSRSEPHEPGEPREEATAEPERRGRADGETDRTPDDGRVAGGAEAAGASPAPAVTVERAIPEHVASGAACSERVQISVEERGVDDLAIEADGESYAVGAVAAGETVTLQRDHVFHGNGERTVSGGRVTAAGDAYPLPDATVTVERGGFHPEFVVERGRSDAAIALEAVNEGSRECELDVFGVDVGEDTWPRFDIEDGALPSGETRTLERRLSSDRVPEADVLDAGVKYRPAGEDEAFCHSLAAVLDTSGPVLAVEVGDGSAVAAGTNGVIPLRVTNRSDRTLSDLRVEASGTAVENSSLFSPAEVATVDPDERVGVNLDVKPESAGDLSIHVTCSATGPDGAVEVPARVAGPVAADRESASAEQLDQWTASVRDDTDEPERPTHLRSGYEPAEDPDGT
ncbi:PQQ-binding-like beta-propeller repeat protein [Halosimplex rubrum]|uniref:PQQ-binding-like beta-propeller repeat protein n=1 Tax=Halosimplex rubrum TaxID=869889 RepID=A0A7D5SPD2_9EURY|nr:PQQ-binding-like beta-propeller repeat protein [Halosimplex rubrum]QLH76567.1 PQQ-binding-like beta-propeller repeat protein [Halosimplex rubrum]